MNEDELQQRRKDYRDQEVEDKISQYSVKTDAFRQETLKNHYTTHTIDRKLPKIGWFIVISHLASIVFFSSLYICTYIPKAKIIVTKVLP